MAEHQRTVSTAYIELDALLDTRLAVLRQLNPEAAEKAMMDPRYYDRVIDDFSDICEIDLKTFREAYETRDSRILEHTVITEIPLILRELIRQLEAQARETPFIERVRVEVNVWPYEMDAEVRDKIALAVMTRCGIETEVVSVSIPPSALAPGYVKGHYDGMILYNFRQWMALHLEAFKETKMPEMMVIAPGLHWDAIPDANFLRQEGIRDDVTIFHLSEMAAVELFTLSLIPVEHFSALRPPEEKPANQAPKAETPAPKHEYRVK